MALMSHLVFVAFAAILSESLGFRSLADLTLKDNEHKTNYEEYRNDYPKNNFYKRFDNNGCGHCASCIVKMERENENHDKMDKAKFRKESTNINSIQTSPLKRLKRKAEDVTNETPQESEIKQNKTKKNKVHVIVTKYNIDGEIYALKIKEKNVSKSVGDDGKPVTTTTCQVYSVKKAFPCASPEGERISRVARGAGKNNEIPNKPKATTDNNISTTTQTEGFTNYWYTSNNMQSDSNLVVENFMPSTEDLY